MSSILILGASYDSLFATKLLLAGQSVELVALQRVAASCFYEQEFGVGGLDLRNPEHWRLKPICSDGA